MNLASKTNRKRILIADDEPDVLDLLAISFERAGFEVLRAEDGAEALKQARQKTPSLVILDLMMPGMSGLEVARQMKAGEETAQIPILMLTAKADEVDRIVGLEIGADDYVTKPFSPREIVLRVNSILRRSTPLEKADPLLEVGRISVNRERHEVRVDGELLECTAMEFRLLTVLMERCGRLQSREKLLNDVWGYESSVDTRTVDTHIRRLREKLGSAADMVETVRGFGYRMLDPDTE